MTLTPRGRKPELQTGEQANSAPDPRFDPQCTRCPRLVAFLGDCRQRYPEYHAAPVPAFGDPAARLLIVGLAPGMHGANRTGRPFTGDYAGILLYQTLFDLGLASAPESTAQDDGLCLQGVRISNAVKCLPPANKPEGAEVRACNGYLAQEFHAPELQCILALGRIAHEASLKALSLRAGDFSFAHAAQHHLSEPGPSWLIDSYHCSRYNTQTRRLSTEMFHAVVATAAQAAGL